jgi:hypothetical protein
LVLSDEVYDFMAENHSEMTVETAVEKGILVPSTPTKGDIGTEIELSMSFDRSTPRVDLIIRRNWNGWQEICTFEFGYIPLRSKFRSEIVTYTKMTEQVIFFVSRLLRDKSNRG